MGFTVGASSMDRRIAVTVKLGIGLEIDAETPMQPKNWKNKILPLVLTNSTEDLYDKNKIKGAVVVCRTLYVEPLKLEEALRSAGAAGVFILGSNTPDKLPIAVPSAFLEQTGSNNITDYILSSRNATGTLIFKGTVFNAPYSPTVALFSSRGPSGRLPGILKPDIIGPGVDILGAFPPSISSYETRDESLKFLFMSGTSMSVPHLSGVAALLKKTHPDWSPAAIKSAIMTTAYITNRNGKRIRDERDLPADFYAIGAGHVNPQKAMDPGLVYDIKPTEYIPFLCGLGFTKRQIQTIFSPLPPVKCSKVKAISQEQLNYPSIVATLKFNSTVVIQRRVTHVSDAESTFKVKLDIPSGISARVVPEILDFKVNKTISFDVIFEWIGGKAGYVEGELKWISKSHVVRSPIVINKALQNGSTLLPYDQSYLMPRFR